VDNEAAQIAIGDVVEQMRKFLGSTGRPELGEADTKAHFIDPIVRALGWHGIGVVQREYYVTSSTGSSPPPGTAAAADGMLPVQHKTGAVPR
jgi:hypothetical protein